LFQIFYEEDGTFEWIDIAEEVMLVELGIGCVKGWPVTVFGATKGARTLFTSSKGYGKGAASGTLGCLLTDGKSLIIFVAQGCTLSISSPENLVLSKWMIFSTIRRMCRRGRVWVRPKKIHIRSMCASISVKAIQPST
jgi:hypothetical protein